MCYLELRLSLLFALLRYQDVLIPPEIEMEVDAANRAEAVKYHPGMILGDDSARGLKLDVILSVQRKHVSFSYYSCKMLQDDACLTVAQVQTFRSLNRPMKGISLTTLSVLLR